MTEEETRSDDSEPKYSLPKKQSAGSRSLALADSLNKTKESKDRDENGSSKS